MHGSNAHKPATLFSLVLISVLVCGVAAPARTPSPQGAYLGPGRYEIENFASGKVLDLNRQDQRTVVQQAFIERSYDGYDAARPDTSVMRSEEKEAYDQAFGIGQRDSREGLEPNYSRYADRFDPRFEPFLRRGYADGYYSAR